MARVEWYLLAVFISGLFKFGLAAISGLEVTHRFEHCVTREISVSPFFTGDDILRLNQIEGEMHRPLSKTSAGTAIRIYIQSLKGVMNNADSSLTSKRNKDALSALQLCSPALIKAFDEELVDDFIKIFSSMKREKSMYVSAPVNETPTFTGKKGSSSKSTAGVKSNVRRKRSPLEFPRQINFNMRQPQQNQLQGTISNLLLDAPNFLDTFTTYVSRQDAIRYSRGMVEAGTSSYGNAVVNQALEIVTNSITSLGMFPNSNDYAFAISKSIFDVLQARELQYFSNGYDIGNVMISKLQEILDSEKPVEPASRFDQQVSDPSPADGSATSFEQKTPESYWEPETSWGSAEPGISVFSQSAFGSNFGSSADSVPAFGSMSEAGFEPVLQYSSFVQDGSALGVGSDGTQLQTDWAGLSNPSVDYQVPQQSMQDDFYNNLEFFLSNSNTIAGVFCNGPPEGVFRMVNFGLFDSGPQASMQAASKINNAFREMTPDSACAQYARILSEIITNTLDNYGLLENANALQILSKMEANVGQVPVENPQKFGEDTFGAEPSGFQLQPSFYSEQQYASFSGAETPTEFVPDQINYPGVSDFGQSTEPQILLPITEESSGPVEAPGQFQTSIQETSIVAPDAPQINPSSVTDLTSGSESQNFPFSGSSTVLDLEVPNQPMTLENEFIESTTTSVSRDSGALVSQENDESIISGTESVAGDFSIDSSTLEDFDSSEDSVSSSAPMENAFTSDESDVTVESFLSSEESTTSSSSEAASDSSESDFASIFNVLITSTEPSTSNTEDSYVRSMSDAIDNPKKLSKMLLGEITESLKALNSRSESDDESDSQANDSDDFVVPAPKQDLPPSDQPSQSFEDGRSSNQGNGSEDEDFNMFLDIILSIATSSIEFIQSDNYKFRALCSKLNALASVVDIPPVENCSEIALIDYLLHILKETTLIFRGST